MSVLPRYPDPQSRSVTVTLHSPYGRDSWIRTSVMQESKSCALTDLAISLCVRDVFLWTPPACVRHLIYSVVLTHKIIKIVLRYYIYRIVRGTEALWPLIKINLWFGTTIVHCCAYPSQDKTENSLHLHQVNFYKSFRCPTFNKVAAYNSSFLIIDIQVIDSVKNKVEFHT